MSKFYYILRCSSGDEIDSRDDEEYYDSYDEAYSMACEAIGAYRVGVETLYLNDPIENADLDPDEEFDIVIVETK